MVKDAAVRVKEFKISVDGREVPILQAPLHAPKMADGSDNPDKSEYLVRVEWIKTVPVSGAIWEKGMFANQNSACKLRNKFTLERLVASFGLEE
jgi:hypothetical protein